MRGHPGCSLQGHGWAPAAGAAAGGQCRWPPAAGGTAQEECGGAGAQHWAAAGAAGRAAAGTSEPRGAAGAGAVVGALPLRPGALPAGSAPSPPPLPALLHAGGWHGPAAHRTGAPGATRPQGEPAGGGSCTAPGHPVPGGGDRAGEGHAGGDGDQSQHPLVDGGAHAAGGDRQHRSPSSWSRLGGILCWALLQGPLTEGQERWQGCHPPRPPPHPRCLHHGAGDRALCTPAPPAPCLGSDA